MTDRALELARVSAAAGGALAGALEGRLLAAELAGRDVRVAELRIILGHYDARIGPRPDAVERARRAHHVAELARPELVQLEFDRRKVHVAEMALTVLLNVTDHLSAESVEALQQLRDALEAALDV